MTKRIAIVGAGITGLVTAYHLDQRPEFEPVLLEKRDRPGGRIDSIRREGYLLERGPHTIVEKNIETARLIDDLGLESEMVVAGGEAD
ncbi:MAG: FAD-dependent oxidoreductase, partial [Bradymonadaceae bacterium]